MIRFSCKKCGKSLRANESIIGRSSRCTSCSAINRVPQESTRKSGEKIDRITTARTPVVDDEGDDFGDEVVTLIADSESDSFEGFENLDFSGINLNTARESRASRFDTSGMGVERQATPNSASNSPSPSSQPASMSRQTSGGRAAPFAPTRSDAGAIAASRPPFWQPLRSNVPPVFLIALVGACLVAGCAYLGYRFLFSGPQVRVKTQLELSSVGNGYGQALFELKKSQRVLSYLERAYLEKNLPEIGLGDTRLLMQECNQLVGDSKVLEDANRRFDAGDKDGAYQLLNDQIQRMTDMKSRLDRETSELKLKLFGR